MLAFMIVKETIHKILEMEVTYGKSFIDSREK
ncbi:hypothetical protein ATF84_11548 [[Clostridium] innocuum]|nr:hypothetical protein ATF84_11548 [[Clostridium] innocuum]SSA47610.1 hypothetical protein SAMN04487929_11548 [[Clostridium] innocuum]